MVILWTVMLTLGVKLSSALERHYYIAAEEVDWDYAPSGKNLVTADNERSREHIENREDRIGSTYTKAIYRGYTDGTFTQPVYMPEWMGLLGPPIKAEVDDVVFIHFQNRASASNFSVHPHGFLYNKAGEGALYIEDTDVTAEAEAGDAVPPGGSVTYVWFADRIHAPTSQDDNCVAWGYHSHVKAITGINTGLVGLSVICRKGILDSDGNRLDVDKELYFYSDITTENDNFYFDQNLHRCGDPMVCQQLKAARNAKFTQSNNMFHINGFVYGNLPDFQVCEGERVVWYFMSLNLGVHTIHANGQTMIIEKKRTDTAVLQSASFYSGYMTPINPGRWLLYCRNTIHFAEGMIAYVNVNQCQTRQALASYVYRKTFAPPRRRRTRTYYLAIEEILWDYAPGLTGNEFPEEDRFLKRGKQRIGSVYRKAVFREYTDGSFTVQKRRGKRELHYGLAGPPIKAEVGERVIVVVINKASREYSFLANGVSITKENEGAFYKNNRDDDQESGSIVHPGRLAIYELQVPNEMAPTRLDTDCITYLYHSAVNPPKDIYSGLFGPLLVCKPGTLSNYGNQINVDREFFLNWMVIDENLSWYIDENINEFAEEPSTVNKEDAQFILSNKMRAMNGRSFGTLDGLKMCLGERVSWHMYGLGDGFDHHHFSFDGNNFLYDARRIDTASVFTGTGESVLMIPDQSGKLLLRTGQLGYESEGLFTTYEVMQCPGRHSAMVSPPRIVPRTEGVVRRYYIGVIEDDWDYCPEKIDPITGDSLLNPNNSAYRYVRDDPMFVGSVYKKALYREFTDDSFLNMKERTADEIHLGILGPFIRGNVRDTIEIVFKNMASFPYNIVPRNVVFKDGSPITSALPTSPGQTEIYQYLIPERSGPLPNEPNCVGSMYASRVSPVIDTYSGLFGPFVICKPGIIDLSGRRTDEVIKEFVTAFSIFNENRSYYREFNFATRAPERQNVFAGDFVQSNFYNSINGFIFGNLKGLVFNEGEQTAWYVFGMGSFTDIHTAHFHGQLYLQETSLKLRRDVLEIFAGTYKTVEMLGYNPGTWLYHCHVSLHSNNGMVTTYTVLPRNS